MTLPFSYWGRFECTKPTVCFFVTMRGWESGMTKQNSSARSISHWSPIHHFQGQWHISLQWDPPLLLYPWLFFESCPVSPYLHLILNSFSACRSWSTSLLPYDSFHFKKSFDGDKTQFSWRSMDSLQWPDDPTENNASVLEDPAVSFDVGRLIYFMKWLANGLLCSAIQIFQLNLSWMFCTWLF